MDPTGVGQGGMPCLNCNKSVSQPEGNIFAGVFVCQECYERASRLHHRLEMELRKMLMMSREAIRIALVEGKLHFGTEQARDISKEELLKMIVKMSEKNNATGPSGG